MVGLVGLVFMEVGLSEDRERERERRRAERAERANERATHPEQARRRPLDRLRGERRKLR
jgi:hypothetical protein